MIDAAFFETWAFKWAILPALIICARILDVSIGTVRIIMVSRRQKLISPFLGFFEVMIWLIAIGQVLENLTNPLYYVAYGAGFAMGNFVGIKIDERLAMGFQVVRTITKKDAYELIEALRDSGYMATNVLADSSAGPVNVIWTVLQRADLEEVIAIIKSFNPHAFFSIEDVRYANEAIPPFRRRSNIDVARRLMPFARKGK
ncbi:MAG TPA: DUF2179 domain-containing protein [candidate division Zixibacteria bacterium]|nr:DUF2179 domain-containing protein [candidate division Zixibacteria bacterium]